MPKILGHMKYNIKTTNYINSLNHHSITSFDLIYVCVHVRTYIGQNPNCERSELSSLFNGLDFCYIYISIFQAIRRAENVLNVSMCI